MRVDVQKFLFLGHHEALESFFKKAQESALIHFISTGSVKSKEMPADIQNMTLAIKILRGLPLLQQLGPESYSEGDKIVGQILDLRHSIDKLEEEQRITTLEIARIEVFGAFSLQDIEYIQNEGKRIVQFFFSRRGAFDRKPLPEEVSWITTVHGLDYFISIAKEPKDYEGLIEIRIDHGLSSLKDKNNRLKKEIHQKNHLLNSYQQYSEFLHRALILKYNSYQLETAKKAAGQPMEDALFAAEGWVPVDRVGELEDRIKSLDVHMAPIAVEPEETPPTYLENKGPSRIGEDLVRIYDTPSNTDKDPSLWVLCSFALFFSMIVGDGGYGLVFLLAALYFRYKKGTLPKAGNRIWKLGVILFSCCIVWGVLMNSFFSISFSEDHPLKNVSFIDWLARKKAAYHFEQKDAVYEDWANKHPEVKAATNPQEFFLGATKGEGEDMLYLMPIRFRDSILMELALFIGVVHICLSFIRYLDRNHSGIGWIIAIIGSYLYFPMMLRGTSIVHILVGISPELFAQEGLYMIYAGIAIAVLIGIYERKALGLLELPNVIQIFADVLSYLRLYALGLAGAIIGATINDIGSSIFYSGGLLLLIIGHGINMVLAIVGGVIHGLRLNFIEWYHYSFEGGGKIFNPLRKVDVE